MDALERKLQPTRRTLGDVDPVQPLDPTSSLTDGLQGFWLPLPRLTGGSRLYDISAYSNHASLAPAATFVSEPELNYTSVSYDGTGYDGATVTSLDFNGADAFSATFIFKTEDSYRERIVSSGLNQGWYIRLSNNNLYWKLDDGSNNVFFTGSRVVNDGKFHTTTIVNTGTNLIGYTDGAQEGSQTHNVGNLKDKIVIGGSPSKGTGADQGIRGQIAVALLHTRSLSDEEVNGLDKQLRRGFPDLLRRRSDVGLLGGGGGPTADTVSFDTATALADGFEPTITATANTVSPDTGQAAAQGFSATVTATQNTVAAGTAQATAQGFAPTISADPNTIATTTGQAAAQGFDPVISEGAAGDTLVADLGTAQAQGFAPSITTNPVTVTLGLGQAPANAFDPDVVTDPSEINTGQGQAAATGFDPTVTTNARTVTPQLGTAQAQGFEPAVVDGTVGVATTMKIEARPLYEIDVEAKPLYRIRLFVKEQLP